ncbi:MAG: extracellular solute-binding protein [Rhodospirillales bacterium]|nr:extracellular solute-binding protein [Rhodospirillales bacterium]
MKRMGINEFQDKLFTGQLSRRQALGVMGTMGVAAMSVSPRGLRAEQQPLVLEWSGYEIPELYPSYFEKHGEPVFSFFASEQEMAVKIRAGFPADITHPCADTWGRMADGGLLRPIDTSRLSNWENVFEGLRGHRSTVNAAGETMMLPVDWGNSSIIYRTDLYEGEESWCMLFDERYEGRLSSVDSEVSVLVAGLCHGFGEDSFNMTDEMLAEIRPLVEKQARMVRFYWNDQTEIENAMATGELVAAYAWNAAVKTLLDQGVPVAYAVPREGILNWLCGLSIVAGGEADEDLIYAFLDAWLDPEAGRFLIEEYGYGHSNSVAFEISDPDKVASLGFPGNPIEMLDKGIMFQPYDPQVLENMVNMFDEVKIGL